MPCPEELGQGTKLVAAGSGTAVPGGLSAFALVRYNPDGSLDPTFGTSGKVTTDFPGGGDANALAVQADGKLVAAGVTGGDFALVRYNPDGSLDTSFGTGGTVTTDFAGNVDIANALIVQADGKLVAAGSTEFFAVDFAVARYNPDGTLDASFGTGGQAVTDLGGNDRAFALAVQDGKLVAGGLSFSFTGTNGDFGLVRYNPDGSLDGSFGSGGKVTTDFRGLGSFEEARALVVQGNRLVAAGNVGPFVDFGLARYRADGALDRSFGSGGKVTTDFVGQTDEAFGLAVQADGRLVAAGFTTSEFGEMDFALARYRA